MTSREVLCKIKELEKIEPNDAWVKSTRSFVVEYAKIGETKEKQVFKSYLSQETISGKLVAFVSSFRIRTLAPAVSFAAIIMLAGNFVMVKAENSLPGEKLYTVKILSEKIQLAMTFGDDKRVAMKFDLAEKRLNELTSITETSAGVNQGGAANPAVGTAAESFKEQLNSALAEMDSASKTNTDSKKTMAMAKIADSKTSDYAKKMENALGKNASSATKGQISDVASKIEAANISALTALAKAGQDSQDSKDVAVKVEEKIKTTEEKADLIQEKVLTVLVNKEENELAIKLLDQARGILAEAKKLIATDPAKALEKITASNEMAKMAEKMIETGSTAVATPTPTPDIAASPMPTVSPAPATSVSPALTPTPIVSSTPAASPGSIPSL